MAVKKKNNSGVGFPAKKDKTFLIICAAVFCFVFIMISFFPMTRTLEDDDYIKMLEERVKELEERFGGTGLTSERLRELSVQNTKIDSFISNYNRLDATIGLKTNLLAERIDKLQREVDALKKQIASEKKGVQIKNTAGKAPQKKTGKHYHQVKKGETFYSISRMHDISLAELRRLNGFSEKTVIYPGQKIIIRKTLADKKIK